MSEQLDLLACKLRDFPEFPAYVPTSTPVGYYLLDDAEWSVYLRFGPAKRTVGITGHESVAAIFSDCCQFWFAPWLRKNRNKLAAYNFGPSQATAFLADHPEVKHLLQALETELVRSGTIRPRAEKEAGLNVRTTDAELAKLLERVTALERRMSEYDVRRGRPPIQPPAPITTFSPPGSMKHAPGNYVHLESINPAVAKSVFKL